MAINMDLLKQKRAEYFEKKLSKLNASLAASRARGTTQEGEREESAGESGEQAKRRNFQRQDGRQEDGVNENASGQSQSPQDQENYMIRCPKCGKQVNRQRVVKRKYICYECEGYFRVRVPNRIRMVADPHTFEPWFTDLPVHNPLNYEGYEEKLAQAREKTGLDEAVTVGRCKVFGEDIVLGICDSRFLMSSMGQTVGEKITAAMERAIEYKLPVFIFCCSGGARMQEGIVSLMQMAKTSAAVQKLGEAGLL